MSNNSNTSNGIGIGSLIFLAFLIMKLAGIGAVANWSWWWVTSPLWIPVAFLIGLAVILYLVKKIS